MAGTALGKKSGSGPELRPICSGAVRISMAGVTLEAEEGFVLSLQILCHGSVGLMAEEAPLRCRRMLESEGALLFGVTAEAEVVHCRLPQLPGTFGAMYLVAVAASHFPLLNGVMGGIASLRALLSVAIVAELRLQFPQKPFSLLARGMNPVTAHAAHFSTGMSASRPAQQETRGGMTAKADPGSLGGREILEAENALGVIGVQDMGSLLAMATHTAPLSGNFEVGQSTVNR